MKKDYDAIAKSILADIGGEDNVIDLYHCVTRLRFRLKDKTVGHDHIDSVKKIPGVLSVVEANGQYQVVIGNDVDKAYDAVMRNHKIKSALDEGGAADASEEKEKGNIFLRFFNVLSAIFNPVIMPLAGAGMIKALLVVLTTFHWMSDKSSTYAILSAAGNGVFFFLPLFLAVSAARVFKTNQFISLALVAALMEPNFTALFATGGNGTQVDFFGIPTILMNYSGTVIPAIIAIYIYSLLDKYVFVKIVPKSLEIFLLPMLALLVMFPLTVMALGPIGVWLGDSIGAMMNFVSQRSGLLAGVLIGGGWTYLVMIGVHWGVVPVMVNNLSTRGYDTIRPMIAAATFASAGAALGVFLRSKDKDTKSLALSSLVPALLGGVTEPIVYGLSIRFKRPLIAQTIAGAVAGGFMGMMQTKAIVYVFPALTTLPAFLGATFVYYIIGITLAFFLSAILTYLLGFEEDLADEALTLPMVGETMPLSDVEDPVFSSLAMGDGIAVQPTDGTLYAPVSGEVVTVFPTKHALGFHTTDGLDVLVHMGINTVDLNGKGFTINVKKGDRVKQGQKIGEMDIATLQAEGYDTTTMLVVTNSADVGPFTIQDQAGRELTFNQVNTPVQA